MNKLLDTARILKGVGDDVVKRKLMEGAPDSFLALLEASDRMQARAAAAPMQPPVPQMANQPPVTQGIFPMMVQAAQQLQMQRAIAPQAGLGAVEPPIRMASGGVVALQEGGDPRDYISTAYSEAPSRYEGKSLRDIIRGLRTLIAGGGDPEFYSRAFATAPASQPSRLDVTPAVEATGTPRLRPTAPPGTRPPTGIASALRTPPGAVAMTTPEMGPPRPDAGIAGAAPAGWEAMHTKIFGEGPERPQTAEQALNYQRQLEQKSGVGPQGKELIDFYNAELARLAQERKLIPERARVMGALGAGGGNLASVMESMRKGFGSAYQAMEAANTQADVLYRQGIARLKEAENERKRGNITKAIADETAAVKDFQAAKQERAKAQALMYHQEQERAQRTQQSREEILGRAQVSEASNERMLEAARMQVAGGIRQAEITSGQRLSAQQESARMRAEEKRVKDLLATAEYFGKPIEEVKPIARMQLAREYPNLYPELQRQGQSGDFSNLPGFRGTYNREIGRLQ